MSTIRGYEKECLIGFFSIMKQSVILPYRPNEKEDVLSSKGLFKRLPDCCFWLATPSRTEDISGETVLLSSALYSIPSDVICKSTGVNQKSETRTHTRACRNFHLVSVSPSLLRAFSTQALLSE